MDARNLGTATRTQFGTADTGTGTPPATWCAIGARRPNSISRRNLPAYALPLCMTGSQACAGAKNVWKCFAASFQKRSFIP